MSEIQSMVFLKKLMEKYSGHTLKEQTLNRKVKHKKFGDNEKKFVGILPEEQLKAMSHNIPDMVHNHNGCNSPLKEDDYIKNQYHKRSNLLEEVDVNKLGTNTK